MKKQIAIAMGLAFISAPAFATKARLEALGEDSFGSQFISDNRNIFLNAAEVNFHKDFVTYEWGDADTTSSQSYNGTTLGQNTDQDTASTPKAEGGFIKASGNMVYGLHFGSESNVANGLRTLAMGADAVHEENNIDLFVGGDAGIQWGANVTYTSSKKEQTQAGPTLVDEEQTSIRTRFGVVTGNISAFANINIQNKAEDKQNDVEFDGKSGYDLGATYEMSDMYYMLRYRHFAGEDHNSDEFSANQAWIGAAKAYKLNDRSNVWISGWYKSNTQENDFTAISASGETKESFIPFTVAAEVSVKEWLILRGSVQHVVWGEEENDAGDKDTIVDTSVNAGASLVFGDFQIDGLVGTTDGTTTLGDDTTTGNGTLRTDALMSRVSMLYRF